MDQAARRSQDLWAFAAVFALFLAAVLLRPLLPIDETRYMSVAWEMHLRQDWLAPLSVNFAPYHQKPPFLFWLINLCWSVFGVSRWAGTIPAALAALASLYLTRALALRLFPARRENFASLVFLMAGSIPFLIYSTLVMFDMLLTAFTLCALLALLGYAKDRRPVYILYMALALGAGILTKGPVAWLNVIFPVLLAPYWLGEKRELKSWYAGCLAAILLSLIPIGLWLIPVVLASDHAFAFNLIWEQTAGRVTAGTLDNAHIRPFYFYLPLIPLFFIPWAFFPSFWNGIKGFSKTLNQDSGLRFLVCWLVPTFLVFSMISGKQPHYLLPLLPGVIIFIAATMKVRPQTAKRIAVLVIGLFIIGQAVAARTVFRRYDLGPVTAYISAHPDIDWAFAGKYHGEFSFMARMKKPMEAIDLKKFKSWGKTHPGGLAVVKYEDQRSVADYGLKIDMPYRETRLGVFSARP